MLTPFSLPRITSAHADAINMIVRMLPTWQLDEEDGSGARQVSLRPVDLDATLPEGEIWSADYRFLDNHITLSFGEHVLDLVLASFGITRSIGDMPPALSGALMEQALEIHQGVLNSILGINGQIESAERKESPLPYIGTIALGNNDGSAPTQGKIHCDAGGARLFSRALGARAPVPKFDIRTIPIPLRMMTGLTRLPLSLYRQITTGCIILFDQTFLSGHTIRLHAGSHMALRGILSKSAGTITLEEGPIAMTDIPFRPDQPETDPLQDIPDAPAPLPEHMSTNKQETDLLDEIEIELEFDLGTLEVPAGELALLGPGHIFDLGQDVRKRVRISANHRLIGYGDLVQIDDRTGVRIQQLLGRRDS